MDNRRLYTDIGLRIRALRRSRGMTLSELSRTLNKSVATLSKYESGDVAIGLDVLVDLCRIFNVDAEFLLPGTSTRTGDADLARYEKYFEEILYIYWFNGEQNRVRCALIDNRNSARVKSTLYFDVEDPLDIEKASFIYYGDMTYSDTGTDFNYTNSLPPFDRMSIRIPSFTRKQAYRKGLMTTMSFYYQNVATKILAASAPIRNHDLLLPELKLSNEEIREIRRTNFFIV